MKPVHIAITKKFLAVTLKQLLLTTTLFHNLAVVTNFWDWGNLKQIWKTFQDLFAARNIHDDEVTKDLVNISHMQIKIGLQYVNYKHDIKCKVCSH